MRVLVAVRGTVNGGRGNAFPLPTDPDDEMVMETALKLKENGKASELVIWHFGKALAGGDDFAIRPAEPDPLTLARQIKALADDIDPQLIILGRHGHDDMCNQTSQMLAALLRWPHAPRVSEVLLEFGHAIVVREGNGCLEMQALNLPAVVTTAIVAEARWHSRSTLL